jgi:hypothetical protein
LPILSTEKTSSIVCLPNEGKDFGIFPLSLIDITPLFENMASNKGWSLFLIRLPPRKALKQSLGQLMLVFQMMHKR